MGKFASGGKPNVLVNVLGTVIYVADVLQSLSLSSSSGQDHNIRMRSADECLHLLQVTQGTS